MKAQLKIIFSIFTLIFCAISFSCYAPSPLYGKWMDNDGNWISFQADETFSAKIATTTDSEGNSTPINYNGKYSVVDNVLIFTYESQVSEGTTISKNTIWDISGAILKLKWKESDSEKDLTLYHVSR